MVFYVRFLKAAQLVVPPRGGRPSMKAVITITTDLGDCFYPLDTELKVSLVRESIGGRESVYSKNFAWHAGARSLALQLEPSTTLNDQGLRVHISTVPGELDPLQLDDMPEVVAVWSDELSSRKQSNSVRMVSREFALGDTTPPLVIWEETGESIARHIWDASLGLIAFLRRIFPRHTDVGNLLLEKVIAPRDRKIEVIELGSGCGIVGIAFAQMTPNCNVLLTDLPEAMDALRRNRREAKCTAGTSLEQHILDWEEVLPEMTRWPVDVILVSDCTYNSDSSPALVATLSALLILSPKAIVVVSMKKRHSSEAIFFELMTEARLVQEEHLEIILPDQWREQTEQELEQIDIYMFRWQPAT